jgi:hypothetical protein
LGNSARVTQEKIWRASQSFPFSTRLIGAVHDADEKVNALDSAEILLQSVE